MSGTQTGLAALLSAKWDPDKTAFQLRVGSVVGANWEDHSVDVAWPNGGGRTHVPILEMWAGSDYGDLWQPLHDPIDPNAAQGAANPNGRETLALIAFINGSTASPICLGFFYPEVSAMMHDHFQRLTRHAGDTYSGVAQDGSHYLAFDAFGSFLGFHSSVSGFPPNVQGSDYDKRADPKQGKMAFTMRLGNGSTLHMNPETGDVIHHAARHQRVEGADHLDLIGGTTTIEGLTGLLLGPSGGWTHGFIYAPSEADPAVTVAHLTGNAAHDVVYPARGLPQRPSDGWRYLNDGPASRVELTTDGGTLGFTAVAGKKGDPITWVAAPVVANAGSVEVAEEDAAPDVTPVTKFIFPNASIAQDLVHPAWMHIKRWEYLVPPDQSYSLSFGTLGNQTTVNWVAAFAVTFNFSRRVTGASGTMTLQKNNVDVAADPDATHTLAVVAGDKLRVTTSGASNNNVEHCLTILAIPSTLPDTALWFEVDLEHMPIEVEPPV